MAYHHADWRALRRGALAVALATSTAGAGLLAARVARTTKRSAAWQRYIAATEQRVAAELDDGERFLVLDFHEEAARLRREVLAGGVLVERLHTLDEQGERLMVPKGTIQHWLGAILVPNAALNDVLDGLEYDIPPHELQDDVLESRVLSRDGDTFELYVKVALDTPLASAQFNIEQTVEYVRPGATGPGAGSRGRGSPSSKIPAPRTCARSRLATTAATCGGCNCSGVTCR